MMAFNTAVGAGFQFQKRCQLFSAIFNSLKFFGHCTLYSAGHNVIESSVNDKFLGMKNSIIFISALSLVAMMLASCESVFAPDESATTGATRQTTEAPPERSANSISGGAY